MVVKIKCGLGNQMFQYAFAKALQRERGISNLKLDIASCEQDPAHYGYELQRIFGIEEEYYQPRRQWLKTLRKKWVKRGRKRGKKLVRFFNEIIELKLGCHAGRFPKNLKHIFFDGYWQSEDYFAGSADFMREIYTFPPFQDEKNRETAKRMEQVQSVSVHVRRGDYLKYARRYIQLENTQYYPCAIQRIRQLVENPVFFVFSDDLDWCRSNLDLPEDTVYVDWNQGQESYRDMQLMSLCRHNIIANSTFSWWGAWLNAHEEKIVIAPSRFFTKKSGQKHPRLLPEGWIRIPPKKLPEGQTLCAQSGE